MAGYTHNTPIITVVAAVAAEHNNHLMQGKVNWTVSLESVLREPILQAIAGFTNPIFKCSSNT